MIWDGIEGYEWGIGEVILKITLLTTNYDMTPSFHMYLSHCVFDRFNCSISILSWRIVV